MKRTSARVKSLCCTTQLLTDRPLLSLVQADGLALIFKLLANSTRLRILHALVRNTELCVTDLSEILGMKPQAVSNQLHRLSDLSVIASRREGNCIYYQVIDICVQSLVEQALCLAEESKKLTPSKLQYVRSK